MDGFNSVVLQDEWYNQRENIYLYIRSHLKQVQKMNMLLQIKANVALLSLE